MSTTVKWETKTLDELAERIDYGHTASADPTVVGPKFLRITDIQNGHVDWTTVPYCHATPEEMDKYRLSDGDIVFARTGNTTGKSFMLKQPPKDSVFASYLIRVRPSHSVDPRFLAHFFNTPNYWNQIEKNAQGAGQPGVNATRLKTLEIPLPPLSEQKRIADILDKADAIRRKRAEARSITREIPMGAFRFAFRDYLAPDQIAKQLNDVAEVVSGVAKGRKLNGVDIREVPYLRVANVQAGYLNMSEIKTIPAKQSEVDSMALRRGDVVMTEGGDFDKLGRGALWEHDLPDCIHQNHVFRVRVNHHYLLPTYFVHYLQTELARNYFLRCAKKTTNLASINMTQLRALPVPLPPLKLQEKFDHEFRTAVDVTERQLVAEHEAGALFNSLVQRAFKGEL